MGRQYRELFGLSILKISTPRKFSQDEPPPWGFVVVPDFAGIERPSQAPSKQQDEQNRHCDQGDRCPHNDDRHQHFASTVTYILFITQTRRRTLDTFRAGIGRLARAATETTAGAEQDENDQDKGAQRPAHGTYFLRAPRSRAVHKSSSVHDGPDHRGSPPRRAAPIPRRMEVDPDQATSGLLPEGFSVLWGRGIGVGGERNRDAGGVWVARETCSSDGVLALLYDPYPIVAHRKSLK